MRIPNNLTDKFSIQLNELYSIVSKNYLKNMEKNIHPQRVNVMLADAKALQRDTFKPSKVSKFYEMLAKKMTGWSSEGINRTDTDDLRRLHLSFKTLFESYSLSCYFGIQYHALLYYKYDNRIKDIQIEIMELDEKVSALKDELEGKENAIIQEELNKRDITNLGFEEMLTTMYNNQQLYSELTKKVDDVGKVNPEYLNMIKKRDLLVADLKKMTVEVYSTKPVLIGADKLMVGEEGISVYFDLEVMKKGESSGKIKIETIPPEVKQGIIDRLEEVKIILK